MNLRDVALLAVSTSAILTGCTVEIGVTSEQEGPISEELRDRGFSANPDVVIPPSDGEVASPFDHTDGRTAFVISTAQDGQQSEVAGLIFDRDGEVQSRLAADDEVAYRAECSVLFWSCMGTCNPLCWWDLGFGQGCYTDCRAGCSWAREDCERDVHPVVVTPPPPPPTLDDY